MLSLRLDNNNQKIRCAYFTSTLLFLFITFSFSCEAFADYATQPTSNQQVTLNMRDVEIRALIQWIAEQAHKQIVIDQRVQGRVSAYADKPMQPEQAYQVVLALLDAYGYTSVESNGILRIAPMQDKKYVETPIYNNNASNSSNGLISYILDVRNITPGALAQMLKPMLSASGYIAALDNLSSIIISDTSNNVRRIISLAHELDRENANKIEAIKIKHASASEIAQTLTPLINDANNSSADTNGAVTAAKLSVDERSNSILIAGNTIQHQRARKLIEELDQPNTAQSSSQVVFLRFIAADEALPILKNVANDAQKNEKGGDKNSSPTSIEVSKSNNAIVMYGPGDIINKLKGTIAHIDVQRAEVLLETMIAEVDVASTQDIGVTWTTANFDSLHGSGAIAGVNALGSLNAVTTTTTTDATGNAKTSAAPGTGFTIGYYSNGNLQSIARALSTNTKVKILSTPTLMTLDNEEARILVGTNVPILSGEETNATTTETPFANYERQDIGVTLKINPKINSNQTITLNISEDTQSLANSAESAADSTIINKQNISTKIIVENNQTMVLGGMIGDGFQYSQSKVPGFGDIPLIGRLFRSDHSETSKKKLLVFIRPRVISTDTDAQKISRDNYEQIKATMENAGAGNTSNLPAQ